MMACRAQQHLLPLNCWSHSSQEGTGSPSNRRQQSSRLGPEQCTQLLSRGSPAQTYLPQGPCVLEAAGPPASALGTQEASTVCLAEQSFKSINLITG